MSVLPFLFNSPSSPKVGGDFNICVKLQPTIVSILTIYYDLIINNNPIEEKDTIHIKNILLLKLFYLYNFYNKQDNIIIEKVNINKEKLLFGINYLYECLNKNDDCEEAISQKNILLEQYICFLPCGHHFNFSSLKKYAMTHFEKNEHTFKCPLCNYQFNYITQPILYIDLYNLNKENILSINFLGKIGIEIQTQNGRNNKISRYLMYLNKFDLDKIRNIAINKKIKITSTLTKKQLIDKLVKHKFL